MNSTRFATTLHILTLLFQSRDQYQSSAYLAGSIGIHPVVVRNALKGLKKQGFIDIKEGQGGGSRLAKPADQIKLSDVLEPIMDGTILGKVNAPNPDCPVGRQINQHLDQICMQAENFILKQLSHQTLLDFCRGFQMEAPS